MSKMDMKESEIKVGFIKYTETTEKRFESNLAEFRENYPEYFTANLQSRSSQYDL